MKISVKVYLTFLLLHTLVGVVLCGAFVGVPINHCPLWVNLIMGSWLAQMLLWCGVLVLDMVWDWRLDEKLR